MLSIRDEHDEISPKKVDDIGEALFALLHPFVNDLRPKSSEKSFEYPISTGNKGVQRLFGIFLSIISGGICNPGRISHPLLRVPAEPRDHLRPMSLNSMISFQNPAHPAYRSPANLKLM